jgi:hypothetical protein
VELERFGGFDGQLRLFVVRELGVDRGCLVTERFLRGDFIQKNLIVHKNSVRLLPPWDTATDLKWKSKLVFTAIALCPV